MARIRTIKPDFWSHPKVGAVSRDARLLFLGLLNEADDEGRMRYHPKRLAGVLFPFDDDVSPGMLDVWVNELDRIGLVARYDVEGALYLEIPGFTEHQRINRPSPSTLPVNPHDSLTEVSLIPHDSLTEVSRGEREVEREQGTGKGNQLVAPSSLESVSNVSLVFETWKTTAGRNGNTVLSPKRRNLIRKALKDYPLDDVLDAVKGWRNSPFHAGQNPSRKVWNELELLLRDHQHIEQFRDLERGMYLEGRGFDPAVDAIDRLHAMENR